ncbi:hypothetical protein ACQPTN_32920 [Bradyrhizobium sp. 13971]
MKPIRGAADLVDNLDLARDKPIALRHMAFCFLQVLPDKPQVHASIMAQEIAALPSRRSTACSGHVAIALMLSELIILKCYLEQLCPTCSMRKPSSSVPHFSARSR